MSINPVTGATVRQLSPSQFVTRLRSSAICFVGWAIAGIAWVIGARFTIDGLVVAANFLLRFLQIAVVLPASPWWYALLWPVPLWFSSIEWGDNPVQLVKREGWTLAMLGAACIWLIVVGADAATTFAGIDVAKANAGTVAHFFVDTLIGLALVTAFFTFWPEWLAGLMTKRWQKVWG
jgi:hypothetical protein